MTSRELAGWLAFYRASPFGPMQEDLRAGILAMLLYNPNRKEHAKALGPADFFPSLAGEGEEAEEEGQSPEEMRLALLGWVALANAPGS